MHRKRHACEYSNFTTVDFVEFQAYGMHMITPVFELRDGMGCTPVSEGGNFTMADPREAVYAASVRRRASTVALHRFAVAKQFMVKKKKN